MSEDIINHPKHYEAARFTCEPADLTATMPHPIASAIEYIARAPYKGSELTDLRKAAWWLKRALGTRRLWRESPAGTVLVWEPGEDDFFDLARAASMCAVTPDLRFLFTFDCSRASVFREDVVNLVNHIEGKASDLAEASSLVEFNERTL